MAQSQKDGRINLLRIADLAKESPETYFTEHEVEAECHMSGVAEYKNIEFRPWSFGEEIGPGERRLFFLRFPGRIWTADGPDILDELEHGFHSGIDDREEFIVLASVCLRRRLTLGATTKSGDSPMRLERKGAIYKELTEKGPNLVELPRFLERVEGLKNEDQHALLLSARFYHLGLSISDRDPELAYLAHVSALEVLANRLKLENDPKISIDEQVLAALESIPDEVSRERTIAKLAETGKSTAWFVKLITTLTHDSFFRTDQAHWKTAITRENLECVAKNIYRVRSAALHRGEPFPDRLIGNRSQELEEFPMGIVQHSGTGPPKGNELQTDPCMNKKRIPNLPAFERLAHHILNRFVETRAEILK